MSDSPSRRSLRTRLVASHVAVVAAGATAMLIVSGFVTREMYGRRLRNGTRGGGAAEGMQLQSVLDRALWPALLAGVAAALAVGFVAAWLVTRRIARPIDELRRAARRMANGEYDTSVPSPPDLELAELADDVRALGGHLARTEQRRAQLLAEVTHELRTPLTVIRGHMEALLDEERAPSAEVFAIVVDEAARMQRLVDDLALLSRTDEGRLDLANEPLDLADVARDAVRRLAPQFEFSDVTLVATELESAPVSGDRGRVMQIVSNLLGNALAHTPAGGSVAVATSVDGAVSTLTVTDTGRGISADDLPLIFDRFYRADLAPVATIASGRGLGLTIARGLARAHGGDIAAASAGRDRGATFTLTMPSTKPAAPLDRL